MANEQIRGEITIERDKSIDFTNLLQLFGFNVDISTQHGILIIKVSFDKVRLDNKEKIRCFFDFRIIDGVFKVNRCDPPINNIDALLNDFYSHQNFFKFLLHLKKGSL